MRPAATAASQNVARSSPHTVRISALLTQPRECSNLNAEQQHVHDCVLHDMTLPVGHVFVLTAPAGTGKTFLINAILHSARTTGLRVVPCASSGLAASLLGHARTGHGLFKIPTQLEEFSYCRPRAIYKCVCSLRVCRCHRVISSPHLTIFTHPHHS